MKDFLNSKLEVKEIKTEGVTDSDQITFFGKKMQEIDENVEFPEAQQFKVEHTFIDFIEMILQ